jgi:hypothetical protein
MIELRHTVRIEVPPARVWAWFNELPLHYREWHPAHVACRVVRGQPLQPSSVLQVEEHLHGRLHKLRLQATEVAPEHLMRYRGPGFRGSFLLEPADGGTRFTAELAFGLRIPLIGRALDAVARRLMARQLAALENHKREEGENLKALLERSLSNRGHR